MNKKGTEETAAQPPRRRVIRRVQVTRVEQLSPHMVCMTFTGDDAALPAIATIQEALPINAQAHLVLEVADAHEERPLSTAAQLDITWLHRGAQPADAPLEATVCTLQFPPGNGRIYVGCEATAMRRMRRHLLQERGLDPTTIVTRGYWKLGAVDYTDHDYGTDS